MIPELIDLVVCDVSFISAKKVLEPNIKLLGKKFEVIVLLKPQFEVGKEFVGKEELLKIKKFTKIYVSIFKMDKNILIQIL